MRTKCILQFVAFLALSHNTVAQTPVYDSIYTYSWDTAMVEWKAISKKTQMIYNEHDSLTSYIVQRINVDSWRNVVRFTYTYDTDNNLISEMYQVWDSVNWINNLLNTFTYDDDHNRISSLNQKWITTEWVNNKKQLIIGTVMALCERKQRVFTRICSIRCRIISG